MGTSSAWTPERRARQAEAIRKWQPWEYSTGPITVEGKNRSSQNSKRQPKSPELVELEERLKAVGKNLSLRRAIRAN